MDYKATKEFHFLLYEFDTICVSGLMYESCVVSDYNDIIFLPKDSAPLLGRHNRVMVLFKKALSIMILDI